MTSSFAAAVAVARRRHMPRKLDMVFAVSIGLLHVGACGSGAERNCMQHVKLQDWAAAYETCQSEFTKTHDLARAIHAAKAAYYLQRPTDVIHLAQLALTGPTSAD